MRTVISRRAKNPANGDFALFGHPRRMAVILEIAKGPLHVRDLARRTGMDAHRAWDIVEHFIACGVVAKRERPGGFLAVGLDPRYPAYEQLRRLLRALGAEPDGERVKRWGFPKEPLRAELKPLFGTASRTDILLFLAVEGRSTLKDIRQATRLSEQTVRNAIRLFADDGIVSRLDDGGGCKPFTLTLNHRWRAHVPLRLLLVALAGGRPRYRSAAKAKDRAEARRRIKRARRARPADGPEAFMPFVTPAFARVALVLCDGPICIADLVAGLNVGFDSGRKTVRRMERAGLVSTTRRWKDLWVKRASGDTLCDAFFAFAGDVARRSPIRVERTGAPPAFKRGRSKADFPWRPRVLRILQRLRTGDATEAELQTVAKQHPNECRRILENLRRLGLVSRTDDGYRLGGGSALKRLVDAA
jgi:DNA-binding IclR family transcriptional regulator